MAADCPHNVHLQAALTHCQDKSIIMAATHESYLKIIDDLKNDLEQISCEVIMVQKECSDQDRSNENDEIDLATSLKELETQNDRLEQALKLQTQTTDVAFNELQINNESLKCQNAHLQRTISEREQHICKLSGMLKNISQSQCIEPSRAVEYEHAHSSYCDDLEKKIETLTKKLDKSSKQEHFLHGEIRKLNEELIESKRKNNELVCQSQRLAALLKSQESHRMELAGKYEQLEKSFEDQTKQLRTAKGQLSMLSERFQVLENRQAEHNMERKLLREEVLALKEKEACVMAKHKSIQEQFIKTEKDLYLAHDVIKEQRVVLHQNENAHAEMVKRLQEANSDVKKILTDLTDSYKKLQQEYDKQNDLITQQEKLIDSFHKWKNTQMRAEDRTRDSFMEYENIIIGMLDEKQKSVEDYHALQRDYTMLQYELERLKSCSFSHSNHNTLQNPSERSIAERLALVRQTTQRVSEQTSSFKEEEPPPTRWDLGTRGKPSEELL